MDSLKIKDILRHITRDDDCGVEAMRALPISNLIEVYSVMLPTCIEQAKDSNKEQDEEYFTQVRNAAFGIVIEKLKAEERRWVLYDEDTTYPYMVGDSMIVLYDYAGRDSVVKPLLSLGYKVSLLAEDAQGFINEIAHMYRNGYNYIQFVGAKGEAFVASREDFFSYEQFFGDDYITNPGLQAALIRNIQEVKRAGASDKDVKLMEKLRYELNVQYQNAEYMVPCVKTETEEEITFAHPPIDITREVGQQGDTPVIAIPAFTDGFEMDKCYTGERENMLYNIKQMRDLIDELGVSGFVLNYLGQNCFLDREMIKTLCEE